MEFSNLIGSFSCPDFPISVHGHSNAYESVCPFVYKVYAYHLLSFLVQNVLSKQLFIRQES